MYNSIAFYFLFLSDSSARISSSVLNRSGKSRRPCLVSDLFLLKGSCQTVLDQFQVYNTVLQQLYMLSCAHHNRSHNTIIILLTIFALLYVSSLWIIHSILEACVFHSPWPVWLIPLHPFFWKPSAWSLYFRVFSFFLVCLFIMFVLNSTYKCNIMVFVFTLFHLA